MIYGTVRVDLVRGRPSVALISFERESSVFIIITLALQWIWNIICFVLQWIWELISRSFVLYCTEFQISFHFFCPWRDFLRSFVLYCNGYWNSFHIHLFWTAVDFGFRFTFICFVLDFGFRILLFVYLFCTAMGFGFKTKFIWYVL